MSRLLRDARAHRNTHTILGTDVDTEKRRRERTHTHSQTHINLLGRKSGQLPSTAKNLVGEKKRGGRVENE